MPAIRFIPPDKCVHAVGGALVAMPVLLACLKLGVPVGVALLGAAAASLVVGMLIEDRQQRLNDAAVYRGEAPGHEISNADVAATALGGAFVSAVFGLGYLWSMP